MTISQKKRKLSRRKSVPLLPALVAVSGACGLAMTPAAALELGEIQVNSALGQPLRASIAYALNPNEALSNYCIYLRPGGSGNGMPVLDQARISITGGAIVLSGNTPVREPILSMQLAVDCPYTPHLLREYTFMIDPANPSFVEREARSAAARPVAQQPNVAQPAVASQQSPVATTRTTTSRPSGSVADKSAISISSVYRVQPGDTVSTIVSRVEDRQLGMWPAVNAIFEANPSAFIDNDVNRLKAGKDIQIPAMVGDAPAAAQESSPAFVVSANQDSPAESATSAYSAPEFVAPDESATVTNATPDESTPDVVLQPVAESSAENTAVDTSVADTTQATVAVDISDGSIEATVPTPDQTNVLQPGDIVLSPEQTAIPETIIPDTIIDDDTAVRVVPTVGAPAANNTGTNGSWEWLMWLGGTGLALILGLLLFGRTLRERFGSLGIGTADIAGRRADDDPTQKTRIIEDVDYNFEDTVNSQAISLDADLGAGTGLQDGSEIDVAEDYGFMSVGDASGDVDLEITAESAIAPEESSTDIIPPSHRSDVTTILDEEVPPEEASEDYDVSMIVDATKQPLSDYDDTAKDLQAIQIDTEDQNDDGGGGYTLSQDVDYHVLEQDYEDELTATQALNIDVEKAAQELAASMQNNEDEDLTAQMPSTEPTNEMPALDKTQEMEASDDTDAVAVVIPDAMNSDQTAELTTNLPTSLEAENDETAAEQTSATTIELSAAGSDITVEMQFESGKIDTKKNKK